MKHIKRAMLTALAITALLALNTISSIDLAHAKELKMATFMSPKHPINTGALPYLAKNVATETGGSLTLKLYPSGQLGKGPKAQYKRVIENVAEITFGIQGYTVKVLALFSNWPPVIITRKKAISKLADIKDLKIRAPSASNIPQLKAWGAVGVYMPVSKIYNALQTGVLDGVYISPGALYAPWRLSEPGEFVAAGMNGPTSLFFIAMNKQVWDGLSKKHQAAVNKYSGLKYSRFVANYWGTRDAKQLAIAKNQNKGVKFTQISKEAVVAFDKATAKSVQGFLSKKEKEGIPARAIYKAVTQ